MNLNKKNFFLNLNKNFLFESNPTIAVGVSGGPDSMALVFLLNIWVKSKKGNLVALIIDHKLREESNIESKKTKDYLNFLNIKSKIIRISEKKLNKRNMNEARINRYERLISYCIKQNILHLFLAHHFNDNIETFLIRKIAGSNIEGLSAMKLLSARKNIQIIRPFLNYTKKQIINFNISNKIKFIEDPSNIDEKYTRIKIRNFLTKTDRIQLIINDFIKINYYIPFYRLMINEILNQIIIKLNKNLITIALKDFNKLNISIKIKLVEKIYLFFHQNNKQLRNSKIIAFILKLNDYNLKYYNLSGMHIKKSKQFLDFSIIK